MGASALMAVVHEFAGLLLELGFLPAYSGRILAHFETRHGDAAGIGGLAGRVEDLRVAKDVRAVQIGRHVRPFRDGDASVLDQRPGVLDEQFILGRAGKGDVAFNAPWSPAGMEGRALILVGILGNAAAADRKSTRLTT